MEESIKALLFKREQPLAFYSPYNFLRSLDATAQFDHFIQARIAVFGQKTNSYIYSVEVDGGTFVFLYEYLAWDSDFLKRKCFKLFTALYDTSKLKVLVIAIRSFKDYLIQQKYDYGFIDIPSEDVLLIQGLTQAGFQLVETRLHFFKDNLCSFAEERYPVRKATIEDLKAVGDVARNSRNEFDRLHADRSFSDELADEYLEVYAQAAVKGFCDTVLVPAEAGLPLSSFIAISHLEEDAKQLNTKFARIVLTAVGQENKGWHKKLVSETLNYAKDMRMDFVLMTTQSTNRAVFRTCEKLNFKLGGTSHILSLSNL